MKSVLSTLSVVIATASARCNYAIIEGQKYALDVCVYEGVHEDQNISFIPTCNNDQFTMTLYTNGDCTGIPLAESTRTAAYFEIDDYSCTGTTADCDLYSLGLLYMATSATECGDSSTSLEKRKVGIWNNRCENGTVLVVTSCADSQFSVIRKEYNDSQCTIGEMVYTHQEGTPFDIDGGAFCVELDSQNICTYDGMPSGTSMISFGFGIIAVISALAVLAV
eukprot:548638_1